MVCGGPMALHRTFFAQKQCALLYFIILLFLSLKIMG